VRRSYPSPTSSEDHSHKWQPSGRSQGLHGQRWQRFYSGFIEALNSSLALPPYCSTVVPVKRRSERDRSFCDWYPINSLRLLGSGVIHLAAVRHPLVEIVLRHLPGSLRTPRGGVSRFARRIGYVGQSFALPGNLDGHRRCPVRGRPERDTNHCEERTSQPRAGGHETYSLACRKVAKFGPRRLFAVPASLILAFQPARVASLLHGPDCAEPTNSANYAPTSSAEIQHANGTYSTPQIWSNLKPMLIAPRPGTQQTR
jgi:hypothetical protein